MNIKGLLEVLSEYDLHCTIEGVSAEGGSYRGYYQEFYLEKGGSTTVGDLVTYIENEVIHKGFEGYKGGYFTMDHGSDVYLASYGDTGELIAGVEYVDGTAKLKTTEYYH